MKNARARARAKERIWDRVKPYLEIKVLCDRCYNELPSTTKALEIFGPDNACMQQETIDFR